MLCRSLFLLQFVGKWYKFTIYNISNKGEIVMGKTKNCKFCKTEIPKSAKICPNCNKKVKSNSGLTFLVLIIIAGALVFGIRMNMPNEEGAVQTEEAEASEEIFYKPAVEEYITNYLGLSNPDFSMANYRDWDDGAGFIMVENTYEINGVEHSYLARVGKDNVIYKLTIDGEVVFSADADALMEYMEEYPVE